jgi:restriction system protein
MEGNPPQFARPGALKQWSRSLRNGALLVPMLTFGFVLWLTYRLLVQPAWLLTLPTLLLELITLTELAIAATLLLVWVGVILGRADQQSKSTPELSVASLYALSPAAFERYVAALFRQKGYHVNVRGGSGDHGVDLEVVGKYGKRAIVQCKRYQGKIGEELIRELYGTMVHEQVAHAFLVTTAEITPAARQWAQTKPITLIDGETLVRIAQVLQETMRTTG